ncbi:hypothetical protein JCM12294_07410 [Desulfocicer niacini]
MLFFYNCHGQTVFLIRPALGLPKTNNENSIMPPPPDGQWARPGTVDGPIGRFLLPVGGQLC